MSRKWGFPQKPCPVYGDGSKKECPKTEILERKCVHFLGYIILTAMVPTHKILTDRQDSSVFFCCENKYRISKSKRRILPMRTSWEECVFFCMRWMGGYVRKTDDFTHRYSKRIDGFFRRLSNDDRKNSAVYAWMT